MRDFLRVIWGLLQEIVVRLLELATTASTQRAGLLSDEQTRSSYIGETSGDALVSRCD